MSNNDRSEPEESAEEWWAHNEPTWRENPAYYDHLASKAEKFGKEWVRQNKNTLDAYLRNAAELYAARAWVAEHGSLDDY
jgi:hypothetical protein